MFELTVVSLIIILYISAALYEAYGRRKKCRVFIAENHGKKTMQNHGDMDKIGCYWKEFGNEIPANRVIDKITWNDLEMDKVFGRINCCNSIAGEQILYFALHCQFTKRSDMEILESKICFFQTEEKEREEVQLLLSILGKDESAGYLSMFINHLEAFSIPCILGYRFLQIALLLSVLPAIFLQDRSLFFITLIIFLANMTLYALKKTKYEVCLNSLNDMIGLVKTGKRIANQKKYKYEGRFHDLKDKAVIFNKLSCMIGRMQKKKEASMTGDIAGILYDYAVGATLWDFVNYHKVMRILAGKQKEFMELFHIIGQIDMAIAIASFRESLPFYCIPEFINDSALKIEELFHPLIDNPVGNTLELVKGCMVTGSNASGKSTFIKAVAVNSILAQSIHTCTAKKVCMPSAKIITSMAVRDDILTGESYYIKEIRYLKRVVQSLSEGRLVICAVDEILKGTNSQERIAASAAVLKYLSTRNCIAVVASHDIELTRMLNGIYDNYYFKEEIMENEIVFEYRLHKGVSSSKNAIRLLEYEDFPFDIIADAKNIYTQIQSV